MVQLDLVLTRTGTVHQRYRRLLRAGFTSHESAALLAFAAGIGRHAEGESLAESTWRWQEISRIEFLAHLAQSGRVGGSDDAGPSGPDRSGRDR